MITFYAPGKPAAILTDAALCAELTRTAIWIDLLEPTAEEEQALESALGIDVPTREELQEIELSSRLYEENGVLFMTGTVLTQAHTTTPQSSTVTFILAAEKLLTIRYADPLPFQSFRKHREANLQRYQSNTQFLGGIVDAIIERVADILENVGTKLDGISLRVFEPERGHVALAHSTLQHSVSGEARKKRRRDFDLILRRIGGASDLISRVRESLVSFSRLVAFYREIRKENGGVTRESLAHLKTIVGDLNSLSDHATFLATKVGFLLDATLGMISNEQNSIFKILSVAAVVLGPPTLLAGIYGMNFPHIPELHWVYGYPFSLVVMMLSAVLPYWWFRRKGWL